MGSRQLPVPELYGAFDLPGISDFVEFGTVSGTNFSVYLFLKCFLSRYMLICFLSPLFVENQRSLVHT
jgi:hypothetical protein